MSRIVIDENRCKGCGLCTTVCPFDLIQIADRFNAKGYRPAEYIESRPRTDDNPSQENQCIGCANCAAMCPDVAITVYRTRPSTHARPDVLYPRANLADREHPDDKPVTQAPGDQAAQQHIGENGQEQQTIPPKSR